MGESDSFSSNSKYSDEVDLSEELSVYAAIAGITLSHQSVPFIGYPNEIDGIISILSVFLVLSIVAIYLDDRFDTERAGLTWARTLSFILSLYLIANGVQGFSAITGSIEGIAARSFLTILVLIFIFGLIMIQRTEEGWLDDIDNTLEVGHENDIAILERTNKIATKGPAASLLMIPIVASSPEIFLLPACFGFLSAIILSGIFSTLFHRSEEIEKINTGKAKSIIIFPSSILMFLILFGGLEITFSLGS